MKRALIALVPVLLLAGCDDLQVTLPTRPTPAAPSAIGTRYDPSTTGSVSGTLTWEGRRPNVPPIRTGRLTPQGVRWAEVEHPNAPRINAAGGLAGAVVYLRGVDPAVAAPWTHPPVEVVADDAAIVVRPGGRVGFVPVGTDVEFRSESDTLLGVRARKAAFFTQMLPDRGVARRKLDRPGRIELTSSAYLHWVVADLFVCEHSYYTRTDEQGRFHFANVPPGEYEVASWWPGWEIDATERDPESGAVFRTTYGQPADVRCPVRVRTKTESNARLTISVMSFPPPVER